MAKRKATGRERDRLRQQRIRRGWSENDVAIRIYNLGTEHGVPEDQLGVDGRAVGRWELGKTQPNQTYTALLSLLYNLPPEQIDLPRLVLPVASPHDAAPVPYGHGLPTSDEPILADGEFISLPVRTASGVIAYVITRRAFLTSLVATMPSLAISGLAVPVASVTTQLTGLSASRLAPERYSVEHFTSARKALRDCDNLFGPRQVIPIAQSQFQAMQHVRRATRGRDLRQLLHVQTQMADLLGWLYQDSGSFQASQYWMATALESAHLAEDHDSVVFVLARKSQLMGDMHEGAEAVELAEAAMKLARRRSHLWAVAATYAAHGYALCRDRASCDRLYDHALSSLDQAEKDDSPWEPTFFDASYVLVQRARSLDILGDHGKAAQGFRGALDNLKPGYHRDRGVYVAREALAYARTKEPEHAARLGIQALTVGVDTHSSRIFTELASVNEALIPWQEMPEVANFQSEVTAALGRKA